jgi:hypothetical protein
VSEVSIAPSQAAAGAALESAQHSSHAAGAEGGGSFSSQHLACVLSAAMPIKMNMTKLVRDLKDTSKEAFKGWTQASTAENIAKCRPGGVKDAAGLLYWLVVDKKMLKMEDLRKAMSNLKPPIKHVTRDTQEVLINKIVEEMRTREVAASVDVEPGQDLERDLGPDDADGVRPGKKPKIDAKSMRMIGSATMSSYDLNKREAAIREWMQCAEELECDEGNSDEDIADDGYEESKNADLRSVPGRKEEVVQLPDKRDMTEMQMVPMSTHAPQRKVAQQLYDKIIETMKEAHFNDFQLFILVPNLNSLYN